MSDICIYLLCSPLPTSVLRNSTYMLEKKTSQPTKQHKRIHWVPRKCLHRCQQTYTTWNRKILSHGGYSAPSRKQTAKAQPPPAPWAYRGMFLSSLSLTVLDRGCARAGHHQWKGRTKTELFQMLTAAGHCPVLQGQLAQVGQPVLPNKQKPHTCIFQVTLPIIARLFP